MPDTPTDRHPPSPLPTVPPHATRREFSTARTNLGPPCSSSPQLVFLLAYTASRLCHLSPRSLSPVSPLTLLRNLSAGEPLPDGIPSAPPSGSNTHSPLQAPIRCDRQEHSRAESAEEDDEFQPASNTSAGDAIQHSQTTTSLPHPSPAINANRMGTLLPSACFPIIPHQPIARDAIISNSLTPTAPTHADPPSHPATREIICQYRLSLALALGRNVCMPIPPLAASESTLYSVLTSMGAPCTSLAFI
ncbi:hypothetical protein BD779DRAFT_1670119 [Infundibulicybe gibba]|nr:hypothetical protein BD779DRAFT_1670119 [Infundibulicybe gibba]